MGNMCEKKICGPGMVTEPDVKQSSLIKTNNIPNDSILWVVLNLSITGHDHTDLWKVVSFSSAEVVSVYPKKVSASQFYLNKYIVQ